MARLQELTGKAIARMTLAEGLTLLLLPLSIGLFLASGVSYGYLFPEAAQGVARLALFFLPVILSKLVFDFTRIRKEIRRTVYSLYFAVLLALFLFSPVFGYLPRPSEVERLSTLFVYLSAGMLAVYVATSLRSYGRDREGHRAVTRDHVSALGTVTRTALLLILCYVVISNLKAILPLYRVYSWDPVFLKLDRLLFAGRNPYQLLHQLFPPSSSTLFFEQFYFFFFYFNALGLSGAFVFGSPRYLFRVAGTMVIATYIGMVLYWVFPSLGPCFYSQTAALFDRMPETMTLKPTLYFRFLAMITAPQNYRPGLFDGIAAFPSLHVTHSLIYLIYLWPKQRVLTLLNVLPFVLLSLSTVYLGWHYVVDVPAGALVGIAAILIVSRTFEKDPAASP